MSIDENGAFGDNGLFGVFELVHQNSPQSYVKAYARSLKNEGGRTSAAMAYYEQLSAAVLS
jgi:hypothetical protein